MMIEQYPWLNSVASAWQLSREQGRLSHAYTIQGAKGIGKTRLADWIAAQLLCLNGCACGQCKGCQLLAAGHHPDRIDLLPEGQQIKVDAIRSLIGQLSGTAHQGGNRVVVLHQAQRLNSASANALLKTLEEPPTGVYLLLLVSSGQPLLPTITSRCQKLVVPQPSQAQIEGFLGLENQTVLAWPYWLRVLGGPIALKAAQDSAQFEQLEGYRHMWQQSLQQGFLQPALGQVDSEQASLVLNILYFELFSRAVAEPRLMADLYPLLKQVSQTQRWLDKQTGINLTAVFQQLIMQYHTQA